MALVHEELNEGRALRKIDLSLFSATSQYAGGGIKD